MAKSFNLEQIDSTTCCSDFYELENLKCSPLDHQNLENIHSEENYFQEFLEINNISKDQFIKEGNIRKCHLDNQFQLMASYQHIFILRKYIQKYQGIRSSTGLKKSIQKPHAQIFKNIENQRKKQDSKQEKKITGKQSREWLEKYQKLSLIVDFISNEYSEDVSKPLINIIQLALDYYINSKMDIIDQQSIIFYTSKIVNQAFLYKAGKILEENAFKKSDLTNDFKMFVLCLVNSTFFIAADYYVNPYYQIQQRLTVRQFLNLEIYLYDCSLFDLEEDDQEQEILEK